MKTTDKGVSLLALANLGSVLYMLVLGIVMARYLPKHDYGMFQQLYMVIPFVIAITSGIPLGLSYFHGRYERFSDRVDLSGRFFVSMIFMASFGTLLIWVLKDVLGASFQNSFFKDYAAVFGLMVFFRVSNTFFVNFSSINKSTSHLLIVNLIVLVLLVVLLLIVFEFRLSIHNTLIGLCGLELIKFCILFHTMRSSLVKLRLSDRIFVNKKEVVYILPITSVAIMNLGNLYVDKYMISAMMSPEAFADYHVGAFTIPFIGIITGSIITAILPVFSRLYREGRFEEIIDKWRSATRKSTLLLLPIFVYCIFFGIQLITFFFGDSYEFAGQIFVFYTFRFLISVVLFSLTMSAIGLENWVAINSLLNLILNASLNYFLIGRYGVMGAVCASVLSAYLGMILPIYFIWKRIGANFWSYFPFMDYLKVAMISAGIASPLFLLEWFFGVNKVFPVIYSPIYYIVVVSLGGVLVLKLKWNKLPNMIKEV